MYSHGTAKHAETNVARCSHHQANTVSGTTPCSLAYQNAIMRPLQKHNAKDVATLILLAVRPEALHSDGWSGMVDTQRPNQIWTFFLPGCPMLAAVPGATASRCVVIKFAECALLPSEATKDESNRLGSDRRRLIATSLFGALGTRRTVTLRRPWAPSSAQRRLAEHHTGAPSCSARSWRSPSSDVSTPELAHFV
ncbi:hypothetical protein L226DRAFT_383005 [Lentinus tigrinus ALCF2SS1-7]|uniref:uncharacterized protein n=1 Tax=Lentinus tigrinus ALCF2SS1-7 TaxID=1328758 RepID=UPI001165E7EA|nr:hypothetical protein L226DRAFT_383005 [Lentinus tigrinus ALCF2SS1-7]